MKIFVMNKWNAVLCCFIVIFALVFVSLNLGDDSIATSTISKRDLPIYSVARDDKMVALSFDAAWGNEDTNQLIDILDRFGVKTTFFIVGEWAEKYPDSVKALQQAGHEIMNHSDTHPHMNQLSGQQIQQEVSDAEAKITKVTGQKPTLFRPPYGEYNDTVVSALRDMGYYTIQWNVDSLDWKDLSADEIRRRVMSEVTSGSIVLFHNAAKHTPEALPAIIQDLQAQNYTIVPVSEIILKDNFKIDSTGKQGPLIRETTSVD